MNPLLQLSAAFGLSASAGLNAYIPLLLLSIMANRGFVHLTPPYDVLGSGWCVALFAFLCLLELIVDKIPGADHVNDLVQTFVRPTAGAILFATQTGAIAPGSVHPAVWIILGLLTAGAVHSVKALARPPINVATVGLGAPVVSTAEDAASVGVSLTALLAPALTLLVMALGGFFLVRFIRNWRRRHRPRPLPAIVSPGPTRTLAPPVIKPASLS